MIQRFFDGPSFFKRKWLDGFYRDTLKILVLRMKEVLSLIDFVCISSKS